MNHNDIPWIPAVTIGADFKTNEGIRNINQKLGGALSTIGYARENGADFTLTATKNLPTACFGKPLILSAGLRESQAANLGFLGFGDDYRATFEGSVVIIPFERWVFGYEYRQKKNPYTLGLGWLR